MATRSITDRLDALRFELKADIAHLRTELKTEMASLEIRLTDKIGALAREFRDFALEFKEFKGVAKGVALVLVTLMPVVTAVFVVGAQILAKKMGLPGI